MSGQNPLLRHSSPSGEQLCSHKGSAADTELWKLHFAKWKLILKTGPQRCCKGQKETAVLQSRAAPFFSLPCRCPLGFLCSSPSGTPRSTFDGGNNVLSLFCPSTHAMSLRFVHQVQACQAHKRNKVGRECLCGWNSSNRMRLGKYQTRGAQSIS